MDEKDEEITPPAKEHESDDMVPVGSPCPTCGNWTLIYSEGCSTCLTCGYSLCEI